MENLIYILVTFGLALVFGILGASMLLLHIPNEKGLESYRRARRTLGCSLVALSIFSLLKMILPHDHEEYKDFWLLVTFTLIHSWLTYSSLLFLLESPRFIFKRFFIDGFIPILLILGTGIAGFYFESIQPAMEVVFGCIFGLKCAYMFYVCITEYHKCEKELNDYYDESPDIKWIKGLIYLSLFMSVATIVAFYITDIQFIYYLSIPAIYSYIVFKIVNFAPRKIDAIRKQNATLHAPAEEKKKKATGIDEKIGHLVEQWVREKNFCTPELNIKDVAMEIGTNHNYLSQYLNNHLGVTFQVWLNTLRIEESKVLLTDGKKRSIEEIGTMVGFSQIYNFSRWFKTITGTTPFRYRKEN